MSWARFAAVLGFLMIPGLTGCHGDAVPNAPPTSAGQVPPQTDSFLGSKAGDERDVGGVKLCWCPPGRFLMGSPANEADHRSDEVQIQGRDATVSCVSDIGFIQDVVDVTRSFEE